MGAICRRTAVTRLEPRFSTIAHGMAPFSVTDSARDRALVDAYIGGDDEAFAVIFNDHYDALFARAQRLVGTIGQPEDACQETFRRAWRNKSRILGGWKQSMRQFAGSGRSCAGRFCFGRWTVSATHRWQPPKASPRIMLGLERTGRGRLSNVNCRHQFGHTGHVWVLGLTRQRSVSPKFTLSSQPILACRRVLDIELFERILGNSELTGRPSQGKCGSNEAKLSRLGGPPEGTSGG